MKWIKKVASTPLSTIASVVNSVTGSSTTDAPSVVAVRTALSGKENTLIWDNEPTEGSSNPVTSGGLYNYINSDLIDLIYPVGSVYLSVNNSADPSTLFGGTWQRLSGYYLYAGVGASGEHAPNTAGGNTSTTITPTGTVGSHTLTVDEMPAHTHTFGMTNSLTYSNLGVTNGGSSVGTGLNQSGSNVSATGGGEGHSHNFEADDITIDLNPRYFNLAVWKRTA